MLKRPIFIALLGYIVGIIIGLYCKISIALFIPPVAIIYIIFIFTKSRNIKNNQTKVDKRKYKIIRKITKYFQALNTKKTITIFLISAVISNTIVLLQNNSYETKYKDIKEAKFIAIVVSQKQEKQYSARYKIKIEKVNGDIANFKNTYLYLNTKNNLSYGDKIQFTGTYIEPEIQRNYGGYSYKEYLKSIGIYGSVNASDTKIIGKGKTNKLQLIANNVSTHIKNIITSNIKDKNNQNLLLGILLGNDDNLETEVKENFRKSSLSHLLAVSRNACIIRNIRNKHFSYKTKIS